MRKLLVNISAVMCLLLITGCDHFKSKKTEWSVSLGKTDKRPYGGYLAYESLKDYFPSASVTSLSPGFRYTSIDDQMLRPDEGEALLVALGLDFYVSSLELDKLINFAAEGNEVIIFTRVLDPKISSRLNCTITGTGYEEVPLNTHENGKDNINALTIAPHSRKFGYQGRTIKGALVPGHTEDTSGTIRIKHEETEPNSEFDAEDELIEVELEDTLGLAGSEPDFLRYRVGAGHMSIHAAPLVMSNYFLLQKDNIRYLDAVWSTLPGNITKVYWNDYFKRTAKTADLSVLLQYPATRWALILAVATLLVYLFFESKRKQRIIPVITAHENSSVSFVETIGRLYYNKADHLNLGEKMVQHFLEWVRTHYYISTGTLDNTFKQQLVIKSGLPESTVNSLMDLIQEVQVTRKPMDETDLYHLHHTIQQFYKTHSQ